MRRRVLEIFVILLLGVAIAGTSFLSAFISAPLSQVEMIDQSMKSVVAVVHPDMEVPVSGFYIGDGIIVTAGHVAGKEGIEKIVFEDGIECPVLKQIEHPDFDCGFLLIDPIDRSVLEFDIEEVQRGEEVYIVGNPSGLTFISTKGIVTGRDSVGEFFGDISLIVTDAIGYEGNSGSALIGTDGEIRGVHVGGRTSYCGVPLHGYEVNVCVDDILKALDAAGLQRPTR